MKLTVGTDLEEIVRFRRLLTQARFCKRIYTEEEQRHIWRSGHPAESAAGIFCAKEAMAKALGRGLFGLLPKELSVVWDASGAPGARLLGSAARQYAGAQLSLSISHTRATATAVCVAVWEGQPPGPPPQNRP